MCDCANRHAGTECGGEGCYCHDGDVESAAYEARMVRTDALHAAATFWGGKGAELPLDDGDGRQFWRDVEIFQKFIQDGVTPLDGNIVLTKPE